MAYQVVRILLILSGSLMVGATVCPNRYYCQTDEIKYRAFDALVDFYLNSSSHMIKKIEVSSNQSCAQECVRTPGCQSANHYLAANSSQMMCDLIDGNRWSNASLLQPRKNSTHFYVMNACSSNPCKNGGTCISLDQTASYKCACVASNFTTRILGANCELVTVAEKTAMVYHVFRDVSTDLITTGKSMSMYGNAKVLKVPGRKQAVLYLAGTSSSYTRMSSYSSLCITKTDVCGSNGLSVSFWFKLSKRGQDKVVPASCSSGHNVKIVTSTTSTSSCQGFEVMLNGCTKNAFTVTIRGYSRKWTLAWGNAQNETLHKNWSHFLFTYSYYNGLVLYFNGVEAQRQPSRTSVTPTSSYIGQIYYGRNGVGDLEVFVDTFAAWYNILTPADVRFLYEHGKKEYGYTDKEKFVQV